MKNKLIKSSLYIGIISWLLTVSGVFYIKHVNIGVQRNPNSIFEPGVFETINLILLFAAITGVGFIIGILSKSEGNTKAIKITAIALNGLFCIPIGFMLFMQLISK
jgi:hypothetical protein